MDQLYAFVAAVGGHWVTLLLSVVFVTEPILSLFRKRAAPANRRVALLILAAIALLVACYQGFGDEYSARVAANEARRVAERERDLARQTVNAIRTPDVGAQRVMKMKSNDRLALPLNAKSECPPGSIITEANTVIGGSGVDYQVNGKQPLCLLSNKSINNTGKAFQFNGNP